MSLVPVVSGLLALLPPVGADADPRLDAARALCRPAGGATLTIGRTGLGPEGFRLRAGRGRAAVTAESPAGLLYGAQELSRHRAGTHPIRLDLSDRPDFPVRGVALLLMKEANYNYQLTPSEFPWFYDRPLLTRYLDILCANRYNAVFLWSGNLFPSIVEIPEYPDSTDLPREQLLRNQEQFRWFTSECARRNISVLMHFYQIHIPVPLARSRRIPVTYSQPNDFVRQYMRTVLRRFLTEFQSVGLYVCPGEALRSRYQPEWIRDVVFAAANEAGTDPLIVVRDWTLDADLFRRVCVGRYRDLYTERKHNQEMIVSPTPDSRHRFWLGVARKHIVNVHEASDLKPFRWGSPAFVREMAQAWKRLGVSGAELYGMVSWRWPYALDRLEPGQTGFWPSGPKLVTFERDAIWHEAFGRYLWRADRDAAEEGRYWAGRFGRRFGDARAGRLLLRWYETTGPILPGLQNLTSNLNMNFFPTVVGKEQTVDAILTARVAPDSGETATGNYPSMPVDDAFFSRYRRAYGMPGLRDRMTLCVSDYAERLAAGRPVGSAMAPDRVADLLVRMAEEGVRLAAGFAASARRDRAEAARFVSDSRAILLVARVWREKVMAAIAKRVWMRTGRTAEGRACLTHLRQSVNNYRELLALTETTYVNATDMLLSLSWRNGLRSFEQDLASNTELIDAELNKRIVWASPRSADVHGPVGTTAHLRLALPGRPTITRARLVFQIRDLDGPAAGSEGILRLGDRDYPLPRTGDGVTRTHSVPVDPSLLARGALDARFVLAAKPDNTIGYSVYQCRLSIEAGSLGPGGTPLEPALLQVLTPKERGRVLDAYYRRMTGPRPFRAASLVDWRKRRLALRRHVRRCLGLDPWPSRPPLDVRYGGSLDRGDYTVTRVYYQSWPGFYASGWLYRPTRAGRYPVVLNPHGHWEHGAIDPMVQPRLITLARKGYVALAVDSVHVSAGSAGVEGPYGRSLMAGFSDAGAQVWNLMRGLDYLATLPDADMTRVGCTGASGGGLQTLFLMCVDDRLKVAAPAVYVSNAGNFMQASEEVHCLCNYVPGLLAAADLPELAATFAPKPALFTSVTGDWTASVPKREWPQIRRVYELFGHPELTECRQWQSEHTFFRPMRELVYAWLNRHLKAIADPAAAVEGEATPEPIEALRALDRPVPGARLWERLHEAAPPRSTTRAALSRAQLARLVGDVAVTGSLARQPVAVETGGLGALKLLIRSESPVETPAVLFLSAGERAAPLTVVIAPGGKEDVVTHREALVRSLLAAGRAVLLPDVRLTGELARKWGRYAVYWGRPEPAMAATDLRACLDAVRQVSQVDARAPSLIALGETDVTALLAAALDRRWARIVLEAPGRSYGEGRASPVIAGLLQVGDLPEVRALCNGAVIAGPLSEPEIVRAASTEPRPPTGAKRRGRTGRP